MTRSFYNSTISMRNKTVRQFLRPDCRELRRARERHAWTFHEGVASGGTTCQREAVWSWSRVRCAGGQHSQVIWKTRVHSPSARHFVQRRSSVAGGNSSRSTVSSTRSYGRSVSLITFALVASVPRDDEHRVEAGRDKILDPTTHAAEFRVYCRNFVWNARQSGSRGVTSG